MDLFEQVLHAINGEEVTPFRFSIALGETLEVPFRTIGPMRWIANAKRGRLNATHLLAVILTAIDPAARDKPGAIAGFLAALSGGRQSEEPRRRRIVEHWGDELRAAAESGEIKARDPVSWLPLRAVPDSWEWMVSTDDAEKFVQSRGMEWTVSSILDYLAGDGYGFQPDESPDRPDAAPSGATEKAAPEVTPDGNDGQGEAATMVAPEKAETPAERRERHDIAKERGFRRMILENWDTIEKLHGPMPECRQIWRIVVRNLQDGEKQPTLKTVRNIRDIFRGAGLIP